MFISTFSCKNLISYTQSAGNLYTMPLNITTQKFLCSVGAGLKSSSETTRETSFNCTLFYKNFLEGSRPSRETPNENWLVWFIGFSEGDGAILTSNGRVKFVLTQKESAILYHIQEVLGFGQVSKFDNFSRFVVSKQQDILLLFYLFNGNLVLAHRQSQLSQWLQVLNVKFNLELTINNKLILPTLSDAWLSGFTDAEGCFNVKIERRATTVIGYRVYLRFLLDQKNAQYLLNHIRDLFGFGQVSLRAETNAVYRYHINSFKVLVSVKNYFLTFPLKTLKRESFKK